MSDAVQRLVEVMDRLRSPGGCPWDAEQTHTSLAPYLLEETYELLDAIDRSSGADMREELGDVLLQVVFHARLAEEASDSFDLDDVADDLVAKLIRRHPHVFADDTAESADAVERSWDQLKQFEKQRESALDGVPNALPALALAVKLHGRAHRAGIGIEPLNDQSFGARLFALAVEAAAAGVDPELALRESAQRYAEAVRAAEVLADQSSKAR